MKKLIFALLMVSPLNAFAADPVTAGNTNIGTVPGYGGSYSGFWRAGVDYSLLTDGSNTFVNAPATAGGIFFRTSNSYDYMTISQAGGVNINVEAHLNAGFTGSGHLDGLTVDTAAIFNGQQNFYGSAWFNDGLVAMNRTGGAWTVVANGLDYGLVASGTTYGVYSDGPLYSSGQAYKPGGGSWAAASDFRVKKDITAFTPGLSELELVRPVRFKYNGLAETEDNGKEYVGVIAQDLEKVLPFMVSSQPKKLHAEDRELTEIKEVDPSAFAFTLINAVQQLSQQNREMKKILCADHPSKAFCRSSK